MAILFGDKHQDLIHLVCSLLENWAGLTNDLGLQFQPGCMLTVRLGQVTIPVPASHAGDGAAVGGGNGKRAQERTEGKQQAGSLLLVLALFFSLKGVPVCACLSRICERVCMFMCRLGSQTASGAGCQVKIQGTWFKF